MHSIVRWTLAWSLFKRLSSSPHAQHVCLRLPVRFGKMKRTRKSNLYRYCSCWGKVWQWNYAFKQIFGVRFGVVVFAYKLAEVSTRSCIHLSHVRCARGMNHRTRMCARLQCERLTICRELWETCSNLCYSDDDRLSTIICEDVYHRRLASQAAGVFTFDICGMQRWWSSREAFRINFKVGIWGIRAYEELLCDKFLKSFGIFFLKNLWARFLKIYRLKTLERWRFQKISWEKGVVLNTEASSHYLLKKC